jgi:hypothetical protein
VSELTEVSGCGGVGDGTATVSVLLLFICIRCLFWFSRCVGVHGSGHCSTLKNRGDVGFREQNASANSPVLDAIGANDTPKRLAADLQHRGCLFGRINFHQKGLATGCSSRVKIQKPRNRLALFSISGCQKLVIVADVVLQLSGVVSTAS